MGDKMNDGQNNRQNNHNELNEALTEAREVEARTKAGGLYTREMVKKAEKILEKMPENQLK